MRTFNWMTMVGAMLLAAGCGPSVECGEGTQEIDGICVAGTAPVDGICGPGTHLDVEAGLCTNDDFGAGFGVCGENTLPVVNDDGITECVGTGGSDCGSLPPCPSPSTDKMSICGRIYNLEDSMPLDDNNEANGEPYKAVDIKAYDPIDFILQGPAAQSFATGTIDSCGRFQFADIARPWSGLVAVAVDDKGTATDDRVLVGIAYFANPVAVNLNAWTALKTTDAAWATTAGSPAALGGLTFSEKGVFYPIFLDPLATVPAGSPWDSAWLGAEFLGAPVSGVKVLVSTAVSPDNDWYMNDTDPLAHMSVAAGDAQDATGANGAALVINSAQVDHAGVGGDLVEPTCTWPLVQAASIAGAVFVQERVALCE